MLAGWMARWQIHPAAVAELQQLMGVVDQPPADATDLRTEAGVQQALRLEAAKRGGRVWRNNSGALPDKTGRMVRFGLGNDSPAVNKVFKSSDLIGITPVACHCGRPYGVFTAYEVKAPGWHLTPGDQRAQAQLNFMRLVVALGGIAKFVTHPEDL